MKSTAVPLAVPLDGLREALGQVIADQRREWRRERELIEAQARETIAGLRAEIADFKQLIRSMAEERLAQVKDGAPGKSVTLQELAPLITVAVSELAESVAEQIQAAVAALPPAKPGKDADPEVARALIEESVATAVAALPVAKDGISVTIDDCRPIIEEALAVAVAALPAPLDGKSVTVDECLPAIEEALLQAVAALPAAKDGKDGMLPVVREWSDQVHYKTHVVAHAGSTYQALRDTAKAPPHDDWICLARAGADGLSFSIKGTWDATGGYQKLDVVTLNGASFAARNDLPGPCPGEGWQLIAMQGKQGKPGPALKGDRGLPGPMIQSMSVDDDGMLSVKNSDGSVVTCDLYPLLSRING